MVIGFQIGKLHGRGWNPSPSPHPPVLPDSEKPGLFGVKISYEWENRGAHAEKLALSRLQSSFPLMRPAESECVIWTLRSFSTRRNFPRGVLFEDQLAERGHQKTKENFAPRGKFRLGENGLQWALSEVLGSCYIHVKGSYHVPFVQSVAQM